VIFRFFMLGIAASAFVLAPQVCGQEAEEMWKGLLTRALNEDNAHEYARAEQTFLQALHEAERFGSDDSRVATTLTSLGLNYRHQKKYVEAESSFRKALAIVEMQSEADSAEVADADLNVAAAMVDQGHQAAAMSLILKTIGIYESALGGFHQKTAGALCLQGDAFRQSKNYADAERPLRRCADIRESNGGMQDGEFADALHSLALVYMGEGKLALAEPRFTLAEKIREKNLGITSPLLAQTMEDHAILLKKLGRDQEAARLNKMAAAILRRGKK
jgi:tetratricopeptide (TPR) repeat protein